MKYRINIKDVPSREVTGREVWDLVGGALKGDDLSLMIVDVLPGAVSKPGHVHHDAEEVIYVASGEGEILIGDRVYPLIPGDAIVIPRGISHLTRNTGKERMRLICSFSTPNVGSGQENLPHIDFPG